MLRCRLASQRGFVAVVEAIVVRIGDCIDHAIVACVRHVQIVVRSILILVVALDQIPYPVPVRVEVLVIRYAVPIAVHCFWDRVAADRIGTFATDIVDIDVVGHIVQVAVAG